MNSGILEIYKKCYSYGKKPGYIKFFRIINQYTKDLSVINCYLRIEKSIEDKLNMNIPLDKVKNRKIIGQHNEYTIVDKINKGGGGNVFVCVESEEKVLAVKIFSRFKEGQTEEELDRAIMRFKNEISLHIKFEHKNLVKAIDSGELEYQYNEKTYSIPFYIMLKAEENLRDYWKANQTKEDRERVQYILNQILEGLDYLHNKLCPHRDLKQANILVFPDEVIKLSDFGMTHVPDELKVEAIDTESDEFFENPYYYGEDRSSNDPQIDLPALGRLIFELLTGHLPDGPGQYIYKENDQFDEGFDQIITKMIKGDHSGRYKSIKIVKEAMNLYFNRERPLILRNLLEDKVYKILLKINMRLAKTFESAITVLKNKENFDRFSQSANSLKVICRWLNNSKENWIKDSEFLPKQVKNYRISLFTQLTSICEFFVNVSAYEIITYDEEFEGNLLKFEEIISSLLQSNLETLRKLDVLLSKKKPIKEDVKLLITLLTNPSHSQYFFSKLEWPDWLELLIEKDFFSEPKVFTVDSSLMISGWPQFNYLNKIAPIRPEKVFDIIEKIAHIENFQIYRLFLICISNMPVEVSRKTLPLIKNWISRYYSIPELVYLKKIVNNFIYEADLESSFELLEILLDVNEPEIKNKHDDLNRKFYFLMSDHNDFSESLTDSDIETSNPRYLKLLCNTLSEYLKTESHADKKNFNDYSDVWRPYIKSSRESYETQDTKNLLLNQIRDYFLDVVTTNIELFKSGYKILAEYRWVIFTRIQLFLLNRFPDLLQDEVIDRLMQKDLFYKTSTWIEYYDLLKNNFPRLSKKEQNAIFNWIRKGPDFSHETEFLRWKDDMKSLWIRRRAEPIKKLLPNDLKELYNHLISKNGELERPQYHRDISKPRFFSGSPLKKSDLKDFSVNELISYLNKWHPNENEPFLSMDGLGVFLSREIAENPKKYELIILDFKNIPKNYIPHLINGFKTAFRNNREFHLEDFLLIFLNFFEHYQINYNISEFIDICRETINFLREVLSKKDLIVSKGIIKDIWKIISDLLIIKTDDSEKLDPKDFGYQDYVNYSINTFKGDVLLTFFAYALYSARNLKLPKEDRMLPQVKEKLEGLMDIEIDSFEIVRSILCFHLQTLFYLNKNWTTEKIHTLFPIENKHIWKIAWESYISYSDLNEYSYILLREHYKTAIMEFKNLSIKAMERLAMHVILIYINGLEGLDESSVVVQFFQNVNSESRSRAMWFNLKIWEMYANTEDQERILEKLLKLWKYRIDQVKISPVLPVKERYEEFHWFAMLFEKFDVRKLHIQILIEVLELTEGNLGVSSNFIFDYLKDYINITPLNVLIVIEKLLKGEVSSWLYSNTEKKIIEIIEVIYKKYEIKDLDPLIISIVDLLSQRGFYEILKTEFYKKLDIS